ncbi:uncharacterized protein [Apostichopus japonicus]|uniref:uncharacterized protein isoform X2 n=1 Tax=Stichopus japonicus TaxID=307972 RepID=UPI003AB6370B
MFLSKLFLKTNIQDKYRTPRMIFILNIQCFYFILVQMDFFSLQAGAEEPVLPVCYSRYVKNERVKLIKRVSCADEEDVNVRFTSNEDVMISELLGITHQPAVYIAPDDDAVVIISSADASNSAENPLAQ